MCLQTAVASQPSVLCLTVFRSTQNVQTTDSNVSPGDLQLRRQGRVDEAMPVKAADDSCRPLPPGRNLMVFLEPLSNGFYPKVAVTRQQVTLYYQRSYCTVHLLRKQATLPSRTSIRVLRFRYPLSDSS